MYIEISRKRMNIYRLVIILRIIRLKSGESGRQICGPSRRVGGDVFSTILCLLDHT